MSGQLTLEGVGKAYRHWGSEWLRAASWFGLPVRPKEEHWIVRNVTLTIGAGEAVGVVGRNGAGKSTLLKLITGTTQPTEGRISRGGRIAAILELGMGFNPDLTGRQNCFHSAGLMGYTQQQIEGVMPSIEAFAEVGEYFDEPVRTYSSGMQVRVAFAVATAFRPDILIVDEALSVGDAYFQAKCFKRVQEFKEQGTTLILVSHSVGDIVKHCDRVIFIKDGGVHADGPSREISNLYLDELFGRKTGNAVVAEPDGPASPPNSMGAGIEDLFHTRRGYNKGEHRWGQGGARIIDYAVVSCGEEHPARLDSGARTEFMMKVVFDQDVESAVPGILIKTLEGLFLYGTNSFLASSGAKVISAKAGDVLVCAFQLPMNVNEGHYMVSLGISSGDPLSELTPLDRRYDSILLDVSRPMQFWGIVDLHAEFSVRAA
ncbi:ABC transporter ATP-binding protein [Stenotrophomonas indicatrix]|jgi:lipopolysaccharide transport system ATP-binding protein|uniref:ABC transporter ATP-binding protein n=1 Tax=Stenotrophomonas indicatrix TaxID=2045451 RepID=A0ABT8QC89_9GAMM|nr:ABC transporter ATP-binding protein [Stenotrophomonas indicatrix]PJL14439.1 ABC transporter ATP-binding protein [Stenotrophomonas maltophilia]MDN8661987.1 ABC transporter ATP-binding protein [Stenotrophomonas indicatrix]MDN8669520.1 ABC transporter ATP-binding protein [Stenotrophomonas indicatrix]PII10375.1 ABC transporter ATP-binding protein [Stenotrophomonas indicatrix]PJL23891.1 ABC transporter ATP-binding protein [Stenotrophomonas maltophilia]